MKKWMIVCTHSTVIQDQPEGHQIELLKLKMHLQEQIRVFLKTRSIEVHKFNPLISLAYQDKATILLEINLKTHTKVVHAVMVAKAKQEMKEMQLDRKQ